MKTELARKESDLNDAKKMIEHQKKELDILNDEVTTVKDQNNRAPTTTMKNMVERLKNQLALKEKQHQVGG